MKTVEVALLAMLSARVLAKPAVGQYGWGSPFDGEVAVEGCRVVTRPNGVQMVDFWDPNPHFTDGVTALQIHEGDDVKVRWKDIVILPIGD